jgi:hypothetical protein
VAEPDDVFAFWVFGVGPQMLSDRRSATMAPGGRGRQESILAARLISRNLDPGSRGLFYQPLPEYEGNLGVPSPDKEADFLAEINTQVELRYW